MRRVLRRFGSLWFVRSLAVGAVATVCDYGVLLLCAKVQGLRTVFCAAAGLAVGSTINFALNRRLAFGDCASKLGPTALRYAGAIGCLMLVHSTSVALLTDRAGWPIVFAKLASDVTFLSVGQLLLLRYVVFPRNKPRPDLVPGVEPWPRSKSRRAWTSLTNRSSPASKPSACPSSTR